MPVHQFIHDKVLVDRGLRNYWGYNTLNYFSPESRILHLRRHGRAGRGIQGDGQGSAREGIEVILDVVYNHTAEGNQLGPMLSFRGIDNPTYYKLVPDNPRFYMDYTGTGNSLNVRHPQVLKLIMDSLRYWVTEMHVDGFRFDLAAALARELHDVDRLAAFFDIIHQDPIISQVEADCRALGRRQRRLPGGQLPRAVGGVERQISRHRAPLLEGRRRPALRSGLPPHRQQRSLPARRPPAVRQHQLRDRPRRLHAGRPGQLQRKAQRSQRREQSGRRQRQSFLEHGRRRSHRRSRDPRRARAPEAQSAGHAASLAGRSHALRRRRDRPHPARQQQRLLPGQRDQLVRLEARRSAHQAAGVHPPGSSSSARLIPIFAGASFSRTARSTIRPQGTLPGIATTARR